MSSTMDEIAQMHVLLQLPTVALCAFMDGLYSTRAVVSRRCCVVVLPMAFGPEADS